jgi:hypothetical protein
VRAELFHQTSIAGRADTEATTAHATWRPAPDVVQVALPLTELFKNGVAHIPIPERFIKRLSSSGPVLAWILKRQERDTLLASGKAVDVDDQPIVVDANDAEIAALMKELDVVAVDAMRAAFPNMRFPGGSGALRKLMGSEPNNTHYDRLAGLTTDDGGNRPYWEEASVTDGDRTFPNGLPVYVAASIAVPTDIQGGTVAKAFGGEHKGRWVQGPPNHISYFMLSYAFHRADRREDPTLPRALMTFFASPKQPPQDPPLTTKSFKSAAYYDGVQTRNKYC